jgi:hypothetical protein
MLSWFSYLSPQWDLCLREFHCRAILSNKVKYRLGLVGQVELFCVAEAMSLSLLVGLCEGSRLLSVCEASLEKFAGAAVEMRGSTLTVSAERLACCGFCGQAVKLIRPSFRTQPG